jgi:hypothetical protein
MMAISFESHLSEADNAFEVFFTPKSLEAAVPIEGHLSEADNAFATL